MRLYALAAFAAVSVAAPAAAEVVVLQQTITTATVANGQTNSSTILFAQFDPTLGVLQSVTLAFDAASSTTVNFANNSNRERTYAVQRSASASLTGNGFTLTDAYAPGADSFTLGARFSPSNPRLGSKTYTASYADTDTLTANLSAFLGTGTVAFNFARAASFSGSPDSVTPQATSFNGNVTLTYTYELSAPTAVPEPATWALMLGGFGVVGAAARRRTRTSITYA